MGTIHLFGNLLVAPTQRINNATAQTTVSGNVTDTAANPLARQVLVYNRATFELVGKQVSDVTTGAFSMVLNGYTGDVFVIVLDDAGAPDENAQIFDLVNGV